MRWRLLWTGAGDAPTNMAVDAALLEGCAAGTSPPTVRFYTWDPPAVSLGRGQDPDAVLDREACRRLGVGWVRRPSGGMAVLHGRDLTYSVAAPAEALPGGVLEVYRRLGEGLALGLRALGVPAELVARPARPRWPSRLAGPDPCFAAASWWEVAVGGRKLVGSAQARRRGAVLQHGSLPLMDDGERLVAVLRLGGERARRQAREALRSASVSLGEVLGVVPDPGRVAESLAGGLARALGVRLSPGVLTREEAALAKRLRCPGQVLVPAGEGGRGLADLADDAALSR